jgi:hypothetical protein
MLNRVVVLAGDTFRRRAAGRSDSLTVFIYWPGRGHHADAGAAGVVGNRVFAAIDDFAVALAHHGHRVVVFGEGDHPLRLEAVDGARAETLPARCVSERPDVLVAIGEWRVAGRLRLAPLQVAWHDAVSTAQLSEHVGGRQTGSEIDFFMLADAHRAAFDLPDWQILRTGVDEATGLERPAAAIASSVEALWREALADEPPVLQRIAVHLSAGRASLAQRMLDRETAPAGCEQEWADLRALIEWRAGTGEPLSPDRRQRLALRFASLRPGGLLDITLSRRG